MQKSVEDNDERNDCAEFRCILCANNWGSQVTHNTIRKWRNYLHFLVVRVSSKYGT